MPNFKFIHKISFLLNTLNYICRYLESTRSANKVINRKENLNTCSLLLIVIKCNGTIKKKEEENNLN